MKKLILLFLLSNSIISFAQQVDLYTPLGIKAMNIQTNNENIKGFNVEADSIFLNGCVTKLDGVTIQYEVINGTKKITLGGNYSLTKESNYGYLYIGGGSRKMIDISVPQSEKTTLSQEENTRFFIMATLLNYLALNNSYSTDINQKFIKHCGTWEVTGYGHSQTGLMVNAVQQAQAFGDGNANCGQSGGTSSTCIIGQHFCFTTYTFYCGCNVSIPFIGLGW